ncbi:hypothetical protein ACHAXR_001595, partial [Thalassiosira sp. AJA248-18]
MPKNKTKAQLKNERRKKKHKAKAADAAADADAADAADAAVAADADAAVAADAAADADADAAADAAANAVADADPHDNNNADNAHIEVDLHNGNCESCGLGGQLLCCDKCNLVYHIGCHRPPLDRVPLFKWACSYCVKDDIFGYNETERRSASEGVDQIKEMNRQLKLKRANEAAATNQQPEKRTRTDLSTSTSSSESNIIQFSESTKRHVEDFFSKDAASQREILRAMLTDQRIKT